MKKIKIVYNNKDRIDFLYISTFFKFCGISVEEICLDIDNDVIFNSNDNSNVYIYIGQNQITNPNTIVLENGIKNQTNENKRIILEKILFSLSKVLTDASIIFDANDFKKIIEVYVDKDVFKNILDFQYYGFSKDKYKLLQKYFESILDNDLKNEQDNKYTNYVKQYCLKMHNKIHKTIYKGDTHYNVYKLFGKSIYNLFKDYNNNKELCILIGEFFYDDFSLAEESINWFETCIEHEDRNDIISYLYRQISRIYGRYSKCSDLSLKFAKKSYLADENINSLYHLANRYIDIENFDEALSFYQLLIDKFNKMSIEYLTPEELRIFYSACSIAASICCVETKDYYKCFYYANLAVKVYESINENKLMQDLYNDDIEILKKLLRSSMRIDKVYQYMAVSYRETKDYEEADKCWELVRKHQK